MIVWCVKDIEKQFTIILKSKTMKRIMNLQMIALLAGLTILISCQKEETTLLDFSSDEVAMAEEDATIDGMYETIDKDADAIVKELDQNGFEASSLKSAACPVVTVDHPDSTVFPKVITIDYGTEGCEQIVYLASIPVDTIVRRGMVLITITGRYRTEGTVRTLTFDDFYYNDFKVEGTYVLTNGGVDSNGHIFFSMELDGGMVTSPDGLYTYTRESVRTRTWLEGASTRTIWDDAYGITGEANGVNAQGENYQWTILDTIRVSAACRFVQSGVVEYQTGERPSWQIDYGNGTCDATATLTRNGKTRTIRLRQGWIRRGI